MTEAKTIVPVLGLDLGQVSDPSALAVMNKINEKPAPVFHATYLHRWETGTPYPTVVEQVVKVLQGDSFKGKPPAILAIDAAGVGRPVADMFRSAIEAARLKVFFYPIVITGGHDVHVESGTFKVPKRLLVSTIQVTLQSGRFKFAAGLPEAQTLAREMQDFQLTFTESANDTYEGRKGSHDDLLLAVACGLWAGIWHKDAAPVVIPETIGYTDFRW